MRRLIPTACAGPIACAGILMIVGTGAAEVVRPGVEYVGETLLEFPEYGASFLLPSGWSGGIPADGDLLVLQNVQLGAYVFIGADEMTVPDAERVMLSPIELGGGIRLEPSGEIQRADSVLSCEYAVLGAPEPLVGLVTTVIGRDGWGVSFIGASGGDVFADLRSAIDAMRTSLGPMPVATESDTGGGTWVAELAGRKLSHFFTRTGYTEEDYIWLCPDLRFFHSFNSGGFGGGASGAFESRDGGRWSATGSITGGTLTLTYNDGRVARYTLSLDGTKLFLDDKRYFREVTDCN